MDTAENKAETSGTPTSVFIGLGPAARTISESSLREKLESVVPILGVRIRGRSAFADVPDADAARRLVAEMNGARIGDVLMEVQLSHGRVKVRRPPSSNTALFVGLGPAGVNISDERLRVRLEEVAPILGFRRHGQCTFVDVADIATAEKMIQELHNQYIGECRMSVQHSRDTKQSRVDNQRRRRSRSGGRRRNRQKRRRSDSRDRDRERDRDRDQDRQRDRDRDRQRDRDRDLERDRDRRRRRRRRSYSSSRSNSSSSYSSSRSSRSSRSSSYDSRDRRQRRRRERSRSRGYSSRSRSGSPPARRHRD